MSGAATLLQLDGLTKLYGGLAAVQDVSFSVPPGVIAAVIGPNGAGKTTLFNLISGFTPPNQGRVVLDGHELTGLRADQIASRGLVRTFQLVRLFPQMTALGNVLVGFHMHIRGGSIAAVVRPRWLRDQEARIRAEAWELLGLVGLQHQADILAGNLTYGQQRLLEVARGLAARPKLLMLDEPAAGLNTGETVELSNLIRLIRDRGITVLFIEHDMSLVMGIAEQVHVLNFGRRIASGTPQEVQKEPAVVEAYLGSAETAVGEA
jgi:branched-chain amino acid transport system ATP-binding protein